MLHSGRDLGRDSTGAPGGGWSWEAQGQRCQTHDKEAMGKMAGAIPEQRTQLPWTISM